MKSQVWASLLTAISVLGSQASMAASDDRIGLVPGDLSQPWLTGGPNCVTVPDWQVHEYNEDFYILRESGCVDAEKPFLYLIFGDKAALLEDTGVGRRMPDGTRGAAIPTAPLIQDLIARWAKRKHHAPVSLVVIHSHGHSDHIAADAQFQAMPGVQFIAATPGAVQKAAGIARWPTDIGTIDLGDRVLDVIPIPGHEAASIALYDRATGNLLTGDSLYPGRLYVRDTQLAAYAASADRLAEFARTHPIAHVLGTHIEEGAQPYYDYPKGSTYQPKEHALELGRGQIFELADGFHRVLARPVTTAYPDFSIVVVRKTIPDGYQAGDGRALDNGISPDP